MKKKYAGVTLKSFAKLGVACESVWPEAGQSFDERINMANPPLEREVLFFETVLDIKPLENISSNIPAEELVAIDVVAAVTDIESVVELKNLDKLLSNGIGSATRSPEPFSRNDGAAHTFKNDLCRGCGCSFCNSLDLHGYTVAEAKVAFDNFLEESALLARSTVLIIHGRGLSSPGVPVLKNKVKEWLGRGVRQNLLHSFSGARPEDGGEGATYVRLYRDE